MPIESMYIFCIIFVCSVLLHTAALYVFPKIHLLDFPEKYNLKRPPIPYPTGIISVLVFILFLLSNTALSGQILGIICSCSILGICSFIDDRKPIHFSIRLLIQILCIGIIFGTGTRIYSITNPLVVDGILKLDTWTLPIALLQNPPVLSGIFTIIWLGLTMNAINWFDGIPGQVSTVSSIAFFVIGCLAISHRIPHTNPIHQQELAMLAFALMSISLASLVFDFPPNKVVLGDSGSMFFGLMIGVLTIYAGGKVATAFLVVGVPIIDTTIVIIRRLYRKKAPWKGNAIDEHLHHRLLHSGWSERAIIALTAGIGGILGIVALFLSTIEKFIAILGLIVIMMIVSLYTAVALKKVKSVL
jgi:UDP-GlcNAc:undecaprenyl-phosphate GlcNAc-1-phosphate transferase